MKNIEKEIAEVRNNIKVLILMLHIDLRISVKAQHRKNKVYLFTPDDQRIQILHDIVSNNENWCMLTVGDLVDQLKNKEIIKYSESVWSLN